MFMKLYRRLSLATCLLLSATVFADGNADLSVDRQHYLDNLLKQDCGSCHGLTLRGGLGSSLLPEDLAARSDAALFQTIKYGLPGLAMPPWEALLSDSDIQWLVERLRKGEKQ